MRRFLVGQPFPYRKNSLNLFRLVLAALVLYAHAYYIAGIGGSPGFNGENLGGWAVAGFFVISGFLITRSRIRTPLGAYLVHRLTRIFPAFIVCLIVTAALFAPLSLLLQGRGLRGLLTTAPTPLQYVWSNITLYIHQYGIGVTLSDAPYPNVWNGSLWTLWFEFFSYLIIAALGSLGILRRSIWWMAAIWIATVVLRGITGWGVTAGLDADFVQLVRLFSFFAGGALVYLVTDRFGINRTAGVASIVVAAPLMVFVPVIGGQLAAPFIAYGLLFLSTVLPQPRWIAANDVSYGFYIYAWPVQQLTLLAGGMAFGFIGYLVLTSLATFALAWASWVLIERPAMLRIRKPGERPGDVQAPSVIISS